MDEVLAVGDMAFQKKCLDKMSDVSKTQGRTILYVSHNMNTIRQLCDRVIVLDHGKVVFDGDVESGILKYLGERKLNANQVSFQNIVRESWASTKDIKMEQFEFIDRDFPIYSTGEKLIGNLFYHANNEIRDVYLRVVIKDEYSSPVTMGMTSEGFNVTEGENGKLKFELDTSVFAPGYYWIGLLLYRTAGFGSYVDLDGLPNVIGFEVQATESFNHNIVWKKSMWGHFYTGLRLLDKTVL